MNEQAKSDAKVQKPSAHFDEPHEVVADSTLSKAQKVEVLDTLEQDARLLAEATSEGMVGGERNKVHDVLIAKNTLELPPVADAYETVLRDLRSRRKRDPAIDTALLEQAIAALDGLVAIFAQPSAVATDAAPRSASAARPSSPVARSVSAA